MRRALAATLLAVALVLPTGAVTAAMGPPARQAPSTEPTPSTPAADAGGAASTSPAPAATDEADATARDRANADLWAVWRVVIALGGVTVALVALLVLYVRASSPRREARAVATAGDDLEGDVDEKIGDDDVVATAPPDDTPTDGGESGEESDRTLVAAAPVRRAKRVEAPPKKLATPDAERVLIRPGRAPVRVPPGGVRTDGSPPPAPAPDRPAPPTEAGPSEPSVPPFDR